MDNEPVMGQTYTEPEGEPRGGGNPLIPDKIEKVLDLINMHVEEIGSEGKQLNLANGKIIHHGTAFTWIPNPE